MTGEIEGNATNFTFWEDMEDPAILTVTGEPSGGRVINLTKQTHKDSPSKEINVDWTIKLNAKGEVEKPKK